MNQVIVLSVTAGVALLGVLAKYLRRRKTPRILRRTRKYGAGSSVVGRRTRNSMRSPNGIGIFSKL